MGAPVRLVCVWVWMRGLRLAPPALPRSSSVDSLSAPLSLLLHRALSLRGLSDALSRPPTLSPAFDVCLSRPCSPPFVAFAFLLHLSLSQMTNTRSHTHIHTRTHTQTHNVQPQACLRRVPRPDGQDGQEFLGPRRLPVLQQHCGILLMGRPQLLDLGDTHGESYL